MAVVGKLAIDQLICRGQAVGRHAALPLDLGAKRVLVGTPPVGHSCVAGHGQQHLGVLDLQVGELLLGLANGFRLLLGKQAVIAQEPAHPGLDRGDRLPEQGRPATVTGERSVELHRGLVERDQLRIGIIEPIGQPEAAQLVLGLLELAVVGGQLRFQRGDGGLAIEPGPLLGAVFEQQLKHPCRHLGIGVAVGQVDDVGVLDAGDDEVGVEPRERLGHGG